ncbi:Na+/H+ antiporter subunit D [Bacillus sp. REN16]|uniref:Na+/H+ antiporter subunit D n=1 Tax=Bacillus sp. REN16 TaxID=2887296 RepID=UPI001E29C33B|nr:Na+/H+ antiporter subunit D [Bacillus sp. REN16]MCC3357920.1 Na+/H+ antiporter subunit D [Bacillus sp. REN16]
MGNLVIFPIIIPVIIGMILVIFRNKITLHRVLSLVAVVSIFIISLVLMHRNKIEGIQVLQLGGWDAPFGISMVADMLAVILVMVTSLVAFCCLVYAFRTIGRERESFYFYPLFLFLITGVNGSFLTGDIFNLFVCFEVMLVSSYVLISLGGTKIQLRESITYILVNLISSFLFLVAVAYLYAMTGTLNMAHLSVRIAEVGQDGVMTTVAILFLIVFSLKAGLFLFFWLPGSYSAPPTAIAAIFAALLTKVGIYSIMRVFTLIFYHEPEVTHLLIGILAAVTMLLGAFGAVAYWDIKKIITYNVVVGVGFILAGVASLTAEGITGSIYYLIHDMIVKALIFLLGGTLIYFTGTSNLKEFSGVMRLQPKFGWMFFIAALSLSGIPPLSGFLGKIFITEGTFASGYFWLGGIGLLTSLMVLYSIMKIFMNGFWGHTDVPEESESKSLKGMLLPMGILTAMTITLGVGAQGISEYVDLAVDAIMNPSIYVDAVLGAFTE